MRYLLLVVALLLSGCLSTSDDVLIPEKATTEGLGLAEMELDAATDARLSKIAASVAALEGLLEDVDGKEANAALWELEITKTLSGFPSVEDSKQAEARVASFMGSDPNATYEAAMKQVTILLNQIKDADKRYEAEKAKKQAEYLAGIEQKKAETEAALATLAAEREERRNDWMFIGGAVLAAVGVGLMFATPAKRLGAVLAATGGLAFSIPYIVGEVWFKYAVGGLLGLVFISLAYYVYASRKKVDCPPLVKEGNDNPL